MSGSNPAVQDFLKRYNPRQPLSPRDALYGGRTSPVKLRYTAAANETVQYVDVTSLYPYVNCTFPYPLGYPEIIYTDFKEPQSYFGIIKAVVYPPRGLYFPILPYRTAAGKLFTLCHTCKTELPGMRVELGYRLGKITEVWQFEQRCDSVFVDYMHTFLKGKQEASGYPADAVDEESRAQYIRDYEANQGILLDADKISLNVAKRQVSKLCLNSFWGKFARRSNLNQTVLVSEPEEFFGYMFSEKYNVKYYAFINDETALIQWSHGSRYISPPNKTDTH
ncbi:uncharacterized protein LOC118287976 [Scophthalmus maximus]|uniref:uncharacterized protein LOC118287976 n=1 Tax=Scophthalmus maximus TaxID=52904 RepID=UPI0015E07A1A|nr:uncharacterized protein LOC118287976 [Scophthalmus maximus]